MRLVKMISNIMFPLFLIEAVVLDRMYLVVRVG